jgi:hypothetical protein
MFMEVADTFDKVDESFLRTAIRGSKRLAYEYKTHWRMVSSFRAYKRSWKKGGNYRTRSNLF